MVQKQNYNHTCTDRGVEDRCGSTDNSSIATSRLTAESHSLDATGQLGSVAVRPSGEEKPQRA